MDQAIIMDLDQEDEMSTTRFDFEFGPSDEPSKIVSIRERNFENQTGGRFTIYNGVNWDHELLGTCLVVFYRLKERRISWDELKVCMSKSNESFESFIGPLIRSSNSCNLFRKLSVRISSPDSGEETDSNNELEILYIHVDDSPIAVGSYGALALLLDWYSICQFDLYRSHTFDQQLFCQSLAENKCLKRLCLDFQNGAITDEVISTIILSLTNHLKLRALDFLLIKTNNQFGDLSSQSIQTLLNDVSSLRNLSLSDSNERTNEHGNLNTELIFQGLKNNYSLKELIIDGTVLFGDFVFSRIFQALSHCALERLELKQANISDEDFGAILTLERIQRPIILVLQVLHNDPLRTFNSAIEKVLYSHPEIRLSCSALDIYQVELPVSFLHVCNLNWHGRYLLDRPRVPLSLWPLVFEKANLLPAVIFEFLKGPAFASRSV